MVDAEQVQLILGVIGNITNFGMLAYHICAGSATVHAQGLVFHGACLIIYLLNCEGPKSRKIYIKVCLFAVADIIAMLAIILITCMVCKSLDSKLKFLGVTCVIIFNIMMLATHVATIAIVVETKSIELMPFSLVLFGFINSIVWMAYSLIHKINIYLFICSASGAFLSASEIVIYVLYRHKVKKCKVKSA